MNTTPTPVTHPDLAAETDEPIATSLAPRWPAWARVAVTPVAMLLGALSPFVPQALISLIPGATHYLNDRAHLPVIVPVFAAILTTPTLVALLLVWLLVTRVDRRSLRDAGVVWTGRSLPLFIVGVAVSFGVILGTAFTLRSYARPLESTANGWDTIVLAIIMGVLMQGFPEELLFRGYLMQTLRERPMAALATSALLFGALHIISNGGQQGLGERLVYVANAAAFGFAAGALVLVCRSLWPAVGVHAGLHLATLVARLLGLSTEGPVL